MDHQYQPTTFLPMASNQHPQQHYGPYSSMQNQQHHQQPPTSENPTLPPLQPTNNSYSHLPSLYTHAQQHSASPGTPHTPASASMHSHNPHAYSQLNSPATSGSMPPPSSSYLPMSSNYASAHPPSHSSASIIPTTSAVAGAGVSGRLPDLRPMPMPQNNFNNQTQPFPAFGAPNGMSQQQQYIPNQESEPTHVVGSQGRRGILPSAPGRAAPPTPGATASTKSMIPAKDADGKFPCPHCNKTYLHAKHLKRHLLRHTGDRPYMCHLCKDTFSRSDILKRHFQKCSIRRGNPTGANHLAHQRRNTNASNRLSMNNTESIGLAGLADVAGPGYTNGNMMNQVSSSPTVNGESSYASSVASMSARSSRANSLIHPGGLNAEGRHGMSGLGVPTLGSNVSGAVEQGQTSSAGYGPGMPAYAMRPHSMSNPMGSAYGFNPPMQNGAMYSPVKTEEHGTPNYASQGQLQGQPRSHNGNGMNWNNMFSSNGQDGFMPQGQQEQGHVQPKQEPGMHGHEYNGMSGEGHNQSQWSGLYSHPTAYGEDPGTHQLSDYSNWNAILMQTDPLQSKADSLLTYLFSNRTSPSDAAGDEMRQCLTVENIKHFVERFLNFQSHWPLIHMPTFNLINAYDGLVLAIICIGAVYSDRRDLFQIRAMTELVHGALKRNARIYGVTTGIMSDNGQPLGALASDYQELVALHLISTIFIWHGNQVQRAAARDEFDVLISLVQHMSFFHPAPCGHPSYSTLHQPGEISQESVQSWNWRAWVEQEGRSRTLFQIFLIDLALCIYFNRPPYLDPLEIRLPLPADDAAWEAKDATGCADALGLQGPQNQSKNVTGSQRPRQPDLRTAMRSLLDPQYTFQIRATNAYSKFIIIHALCVQIWKVQRANLDSGAGGHVGIDGFTNSSPSTPLGSFDWTTNNGLPTSGMSTPTGGVQVQNPQTLSMLKTLHAALQKWKKTWDDDIMVQYPPFAVTPRRIGFSRDGIHFYYLAQSFLRCTKASDWTNLPDFRFMQVMTLLKKIKAFVVSDNQSKGLDFGSVGDMDDNYGVGGDLTLDMKLLFRPYDAQHASPDIGYM